MSGARLRALALACLALGAVAVRPGAALASTGGLQELYRGARASGVGGAFTAVADDEEAIFYNPAGLAGQTDSRITYTALNAEISKDTLTSYADLSSALGSTTASSLNALMGKDVYGRAQLAPSFTMKGFGVAILIDGQVAFNARNEAYPTISFMDQVTQGLQVAYGASVLSRSGRVGSSDLRVGIAGKVLWRRGGIRILDNVALLNPSPSALQDMIGNFGMGVGADLGLQYVMKPNSRLQISAGAAWTDIGNTTFKSSADPINSNVSFGLAAKYMMPQITTILSYDYRHAFNSTDPQMRNHIGLEIDFPFINLLTGYSQTSFTYGVSFDAWLFKVTALSYAEELGTFANQDSERRYMLSASLSFGL